MLSSWIQNNVWTLETLQTTCATSTNFRSFSHRTMDLEKQNACWIHNGVGVLAMTESNKVDQIHLFNVVICMILEKCDLETICWCYDMVNLNAFKPINHKMNLDTSALALGVRVLAIFLGDVILVLQILVRIVFKTLIFLGLGFFVHRAIIDKTMTMAIVFCLGSSVSALFTSCSSKIDEFDRSCNTCSYVSRERSQLTTTICTFLL